MKNGFQEMKSRSDDTHPDLPRDGLWWTHFSSCCRRFAAYIVDCKLQLADVRWLVWLWLGWTYWQGALADKAMSQPQPRKAPIPKCGRCGGELELMAITNQVGATIWKRQPSQEPSPQPASRGPP